MSPSSGAPCAPLLDTPCLLRRAATVHTISHLVCTNLTKCTPILPVPHSPAKAARDGGVFVPDSIPDGFYLVGNSRNPQGAWHTAMIAAVKQVTHIAPPDANGLIIGEPVTQDGVVLYPTKDLFLCSSVTNATYATTTEVYPDSARTNPVECNNAQVACITGGLDFYLGLGLLPNLMM